MPTASIIVPVYNGEKFINDAIRSILNQSYQDIEVIVIDDASKDNTETVVKNEFGDVLNEKLFYFRNSENKERSYSRNLGVKKARSPYVFFLDYDDVWKNTYVKEAIDKFQETDADILFFWPRTFINQDGKIERKSKKSPFPTVEGNLFSSLVGYPSCSAFKKSSFPFSNEKLNQREDWEIYLRAFQENKKIQILDSDLVQMREHAGRTSRSMAFLEATLAVHKLYRRKIPLPYKGVYYFHLSDTCFRFGHFPLGYWYLFKSFMWNPLILFNFRRLLALFKRALRIDRFFRFLLYKWSKVGS